MFIEPLTQGPCKLQCKSYERITFIKLPAVVEKSEVTAKEAIWKNLNEDLIVLVEVY